MNVYDSIHIVGGKGMLGHALADQLTARGRRFLTPDLPEIDITAPQSLNRYFAEHKPTLIVNCAAHTKVDQCEQEKEKADAINGYAVGHLASLCKSSGAVLVHISTDFVFDGSQRRPYRVDDVPNPLSAYGKSKLLGEIELQKHPPARWLIVRTAWLYGRHGPNFPRTMVQAAQAGKPLTVVNDQSGSPTYTADLAGAILDLVDSGANGIFHGTNSGQTTWFDFAKAALEEFGLPTDIASISSAEWAQKRPTAAVRPSYSVLDLQPLERKIGRQMRPWREGLKDYRAAVKLHGF
jgi:dTDP-4-dehydrorhamnose reductase